MDIVVLVKQVPDTWAERRLAESDKTLDRESVDAVMNEIDEYAVEEALRLKEAHGGEVTVLTMGPERATETIRKALSMGADKAVHGQRPGAARLLRGADRARRWPPRSARIPYDLVVLGSESTDARLSVMAAMLAEKLGLPQLSGARKVDGRRQHGDHRAADRDRLRPGPGLDARRGQRGREDQRAAVPVVQGDHGREEEAGADGDRRRPRPRRRRGGPGQRDQRGGRDDARGRRGRPARSSRTRATAA